MSTHRDHKLGRYRLGVVPLARTGPPFQARFTGRCWTCRHPIKPGASVRFIGNALVHVKCPVMRHDKR